MKNSITLNFIKLLALAAAVGVGGVAIGHLLVGRIDAIELFFIGFVLGQVGMAGLVLFAHARMP